MVIQKGKLVDSPLAVNLRRYREQSGMSQEELAHAAKTTSIAMIENGSITSPRKPTLERITAVLTSRLGFGVTESMLWERESEIEAADPKVYAEFLASPLSSPRPNPAEEIELKKMRFQGMRPTVETYYLGLKMLRSAEKDGEPHE